MFLPKLCWAASNYVPLSAPIFTCFWNTQCLLKWFVEFYSLAASMSFRSGRHKVAPASQGPVACTHMYRVKRRTLNSSGLTNVIVHTGWSVNHYWSAFLKAYAPLTFPCRFSLAAFLISKHIARVLSQSVTHSLTHSQVAPEDRMTNCTAFRAAHSKRNKAVVVITMPRQTWHNGHACSQCPYPEDGLMLKLVDLASLWAGENNSNKHH